MARSGYSRIIFPVVLVAVIFGSLQCRQATGVVKDPVEQEAEDLLVQYVRINTSNPPGNETAGAQFLQQFLAKEGIESQLLGTDPSRKSLYARLRSGHAGGALVLMHHIDVVPAVPAEWTKPPFEGTRANGYIWGRGTLDVKSLGIAQLMAFVDLKRRGVKLTRDVIFLAVADEELGGGAGARALLEKHPELFADVGFVLNEGGYNETIVDFVTFWGIETQQKVPLWLRLKAKGAPGHGAAPPDNGGSVAKLVRALSAVQQIETPYRLTNEVRDYFHEAGKARNDGRGALLRTISEPLDVKKVESVLPSGYRSLLRDTVAITRISGGTAINSIPATASADIDIRLLPDTKPEEMLAKVKAAAGENAEVEVLLESQPVAASTADTELFRILVREMKRAEPKSHAAAIVGGGTSDSRFFRARGVVAYGIAPFKVNYYDADGVHASDERIRARFFSQGVRLVRSVVHEFAAAKR